LHEPLLHKNIQIIRQVQGTLIEWEIGDLRTGSDGKSNKMRLNAGKAHCPDRVKIQAASSSPGSAKQPLSWMKIVTYIGATFDPISRTS
jgi:hypothetical protein